MKYRHLRLGFPLFASVCFLFLSSSAYAAKLAEYRFDELVYNGTAGEVIDSHGNFHGRAINAQPTEGKICTAVDLSASGISDYVILDPATFDNQDDFTISLWVKTSKTGNQSLLSGAATGQDNEMLMWFPSHTSFQPYLKGGTLNNISVTSFADNNWHHLLWTRTNDQNCLYRDSVFQGCTTLTTDSVTVESLFLGQEQDSVGGSLVSSQAVEGLIDELMIYDNALTQSEINTLYNNQNAGLNDDGSARTCPQPEPIAEFRFEDLSWNNVAGEVTDSSGNGNDGRALRGSSLAETSPALTGNPGTCGYAFQNDGSIQVTGLPVDTSTIGAKTTVTFWMNWDGTNNVMPIGWNFHDIWMTSGLMGFNTWNNDLRGISTSGFANTWLHVAVEFTNGSVDSNKIFIDGIEQSLTQYNNANTSRAYVNSELRIGGVSNSTQYDFHGSIDEVRVYNGALTSAQIQTIMAERHPCTVEEAVLEYRFDEFSWNGTSGEVIDRASDAIDGVAVGDADTIFDGQVCGAGTFDGTGDYVDVTGFDTYLRDTASVAYWFKTTQTGNDTAWNAPGILGLEVAGNGNDIFWGYLDASGHLRMQKGNGSSTRSDSPVNDGNWQHVVMTWNADSGATQLFINGVLEDTATSESGIVTNSFSSIGRIDGSYSALNFIGEVDEVLAFDSILSATDVSDIYNNQLNGRNYDGTERECKVPLVEYRLEESSWTGAAAEVQDQLGNFDAQAINGAATATDTPAIVGNPGTCGFGEFDGSNDYIALPNSFPNLTDSFTVTAWINPSDLSAGSRIFIDDEQDNGQTRGYGFSLGDPGSGRLRFYSRNVSPISVDTPAVISADTWSFVSIVHDATNKTRQIYVNGVAQSLNGGSSVSTYTGSWGEDDGPATIGGETDSGETNNRFTGKIDEVRVYTGALTQTEIASVYAETHACAIPVVHHYEISHDGQGLTCDAETVTIRACADASCSSLSAQATSLNVLADGAIVATPTFVGSTTISFNNTDVETVTMSISSPSIAASNPTVCDDGSGSSCDIVFADAGFRFLSGTSNSSVIPNQTSGIVFGDALKVQAVENTDGVCTGIFSGNRAIELAQENVNPGGTSGLSFNVDGSPIAKHSGSTSVTLNFDSDSIATIPNPAYLDAGQIRLRANYSVGGVNLSGSSNAFWVSPANFVISAQSGGNALNGASASASTTHPAGDNFDFVVSAYNGASTPQITQNYSPGQLQLRLNRTGPTLSVSENGRLNYSASGSVVSSVGASFENVNLTNFVSGVSSFSGARYSEVGLINVDIQDNNYGNEGIIVPANAIDIGRFVPAYFTQTVVDNGSLVANYASGTDFTAYIGQMDELDDTKGAITYLSKPTYAITAYNRQGEITRNYYQDSEGSVNDFMNLTSANVSVTVPTADQAALGVDSTALAVNATMNAGTLSQNDLTVLPTVTALPKGVLHYQLADTDHFVYPRNANSLVAPFTSDIEFAVSAITDGDGVSATSVSAASPTGVELRFGRMNIENSFGPETSDFPQQMKIEYFDGDTFIVSTSDSLSSFDPARIVLSNISLDPALSDVLGSSGTFIGGKAQSILLEATGAGNQGEIGVTYEALDWFTYDWDSDGSFDDDPSAVATFGIYRGNDRTIHWREVFND